MVTPRIGSVPRVTRGRGRATGRALALCPVAASLALALGCGTRSDPNAPLPLCVDDSQMQDDDAPIKGTCQAPITLPIQKLVVRGTLGGCLSAPSGWCGRDSAGEDVFHLPITGPIDLVFSFRPDETDFAPTLRVVRDVDGSFEPCDSQPLLRNTEVCAPDAAEVDEITGDIRKWAILAEPGDYYVFIDGPGAGGSYAMDIEYGVAAIGNDCPLETPATQVAPGESFVLSGQLPAGQGRIDGKCGGPGTEIRYQLNVEAPSTVWAYAYGPDAPVVSLRTSCAGNPEFACGQASAGEGAYTEAFVEGPKAVYLVVDQNSVGASEFAVEFGAN